MAYIILLIIAPFTLTLFNIWHFSKISANQMLAYVGSMSSAFCTINLALLTYSFNVRAKNESERLKRKTIAHANTQEVVIINRYDKSLQIQIPFIILTENPYGDIRYEVTNLSLLNSRTKLYFFRDPDSIETSGGKNTTTPIINIDIVLKEGKEVMIDSKFTIVLSVDIINDGVITKNNILLEIEMEMGKHNQFKILHGTQL